MNVPKIRINGFDGEWVDCAVKDVLRHEASALSQNQLGEDNGAYPVYGASGYIQQIDSYAQSEDYIGVVKDGAGVGRINLYPAYSSVLGTLHYLKAVDNNDIHFLCNLIQTKDLSSYSTGSTIPHIYFKDYADMEISVPSADEQQQIAEYFGKLDSLIEATGKKIASLKQTKQACLQQMFAAEGETTPRVRFKGFEGEWIKVKLNDILTERHECSTITKELPQLSFTIAEGVIRPENRKSNKRDFLIKDIDNKRYLVTKVGDIIYNPANVIYGAIHRNSLCNGVVSPIYKIFKTEQDSTFMECCVRRPYFIAKLSMRTEGTVTKLKTLKPESFLEMEVLIAPSIEEQKLVGLFFANVDSRISLEEQRLEKLKQIKAACLENMFV